MQTGVEKAKVMEDGSSKQLLVQNFFEGDTESSAFLGFQNIGEEAFLLTLTGI